MTQISTGARNRPPGLVRAHNALLDYEVVAPRHGELYQLVSYHYQALLAWHIEHTGWRIEQRGNMFRLLRASALLPTGYMHSKSKMAEPRDFAYLTWILWYAASRQLTGRENSQQFLLSHLARAVQDQAKDSNGEALLDLLKVADRRSMVRALKYLEALGGLQLVEGQTQDWIERESEVLYEFTDVVYLYIMALNPDAAAQVVAQQNTHTSALASTLMESDLTPVMRAWRALLVGPAFLRYDDPEGYEVLLTHADLFEQEITSAFGWSLEVNRHYACIVRGSGASLDPTPLLNLHSSLDQMLLLLCGMLRGQVESGAVRADAYGCLRMHSSDLEDLFTHVRTRYGNNWGKEAREASAMTLLEDLYERMRQLGLLRGPDGAGNALVLPTAARYAPAYAGADQETRRSGRNRGKRAQTSENGLNTLI